MLVKLVKELRKTTGAGFLDCKKALEASDMNVDKAIEWLKEKGIANAAKKIAAIAAEGVVSIVTKNNISVMYEINSQTDFVVQNAEFKQLVEQIGNTLVNFEFNTIKEANNIIVEKNKTIKDLTIEATAKIGEKIELRRVIRVVKKDNEVIGTYVHTNKQIAAIVVVESQNYEVARNVSMHVASMNPQFLDKNSIDSKKIDEIKQEINKSKSLEGKPENIKEKIAIGMLRKKLSELTLVDQEFVMEKMLVSKYLQNNNSKAKAMFRFEVGEGIEKQEQDFAKEVATKMK